MSSWAPTEYKTKNWSSYNDSLKQRGSLSIRFDPEMVWTPPLATRQEKFIRDLKNALIRIENKTYGVCRVTGKLIDAERLKLVPHATLSMEAKLNQR